MLRRLRRPLLPMSGPAPAVTDAEADSAQTAEVKSLRLPQTAGNAPAALQILEISAPTVEARSLKGDISAPTAAIRAKFHLNSAQTAERNTKAK